MSKSVSHQLKVRSFFSCEWRYVVDHLTWRARLANFSSLGRVLSYTNPKAGRIYSKWTVSMVWRRIVFQLQAWGSDVWHLSVHLILEWSELLASNARQLKWVLGLSLSSMMLYHSSRFWGFAVPCLIADSFCEDSSLASNDRVSCYSNTKAT